MVAKWAGNGAATDGRGHMRGFVHTADGRRLLDAWSSEYQLNMRRINLG